jgi:hypothetical protein
MSRKTVVGIALAFLIVGITAPNASASCSPPKSISTYNAGTGGFAYWHSTLAQTPGSALVSKMWSGAVDFTGTCHFLYFGQTPGDIGLAGSFGEACLPGAACPSGPMSVFAAVTKGGATDFLTTQTTETPGGGVTFDFSNHPHQMVSLGRARITSSSRVGSNVNIGVAVDSQALGLYDGTASQVTGYNILSAPGAADPGRAASSYSLRGSIAAANGGAGAGSTAVDCTTNTPQWVVVQLITPAGPTPAVGPATKVNCDTSLADPKFKKIQRPSIGNTAN